jgi:hypothetical protein
LHPVYAWLAGKKPHFNTANLFAYNLAQPEYEIVEIREKIANRYFSIIVLDDQSGFYNSELVSLVEESYKLEKKIEYKNKKEFSTLSGLKTRPETIWSPR